MNFKQSTSLFLALLVLFSSTHFALNIHSCHGVIAAVETIFDTKTACQSPSETSKSGCCQKHQEQKKCCSNDTIKASIDDVVMANEVQFQFCFVFQDINHSDFEFRTYSYSMDDALDYYCDSNAPPLYKLYRKLILYA